MDTDIHLREFTTSADFLAAFRCCPTCETEGRQATIVIQRKDDPASAIAVTAGSCERGHVWVYCPFCQWRIRGEREELRFNVVTLLILHACPESVVRRCAKIGEVSEKDERLAATERWMQREIRDEHYRTDQLNGERTPFQTHALLSRRSRSPIHSSCTS